jgi:dihydrolipoamide dehydrogenase
MDKFDVAVIGGGPGGYVAAIRASQLGLKVLLVERQHLGGICLNWGCIPTKSLLKSSEVLNMINHSDDYGISVENVKFDIKKMVERSRNVANQLQNGVKGLLKKNKVTVVDGSAKFLASNKISVADKTFEAKNIIIATGARARIIKGLEPDGTTILTYKEAMLQEEVPQNLAIIGAGAIGVEFASFYNALGSKVTIIEMQNQILAQEDREISDLAASAFKKNGIDIYTNTVVKSFNKNLNKKGELSLEKDGKALSLSVDKIIVAAGVVGNVENLGLENTKVKVENNQIVVNEYLMTDQPGVYAIGDVISPPWLAHKASHEGILCAEQIAGHKIQPILRENIPGCVYSNPQISSVGLTEEKALALGKQIKVGRFPFMANGKALALGEGSGLVKTIFDAETGELLGAHMIGHEVTELIQSLVLAKTAELTEQEIMHTIFPHPTLSEMLHESVLNAFNKSIHI